MFEEVRAFLPPETEQPVQLDLCGISYCDGSYRVERHHTPIYVFEYVIKGTGTLIVDGRTYTASAGDVYIIPENSDHCYFSDDKDPWTKIFFNVRGKLVGRLIRSYGLTGRVVTPDCDLLPQFLQFYACAKQDTAHDKIIGPCTLKMHEIIQRLYEAGREKSAVSAEALQLKTILDSRVQGDIRTEELAAAIYRSKDYVIKLFRREFGETPHSYFLRQKMVLAQSLLTSTKLSVKQIAASLGYDDQHYFSNVFKKVTGQSPMEYRKA